MERSGFEVHEKSETSEEMGSENAEQTEGSRSCGTGWDRGAGVESVERKMPGTPAFKRQREGVQENELTPKR